MGILDMIGPVMIGPSSSHTAGACRIGLLARAILDARPEKATITDPIARRMRRSSPSFIKRAEAQGADSDRTPLISVANFSIIAPGSTVIADSHSALI